MTNKAPNQNKPATTQNDSQQIINQSTQTEGLLKSTPNETDHQDKETPAAQPKPKQTKMLPIDINISGKVYTINCPANEVDELRSASKYINNFIQDIRKNAPQLTHENLLVLCCLNLYEYVQEIKSEAADNTHMSKTATALVDKMIKDMQIV